MCHWYLMPRISYQNKICLTTVTHNHIVFLYFLTILKQFNSVAAISIVRAPPAFSSPVSSYDHDISLYWGSSRFYSVMEMIPATHYSLGLFVRPSVGSRNHTQKYSFCHSNVLGLTRLGIPASRTTHDTASTET